MINFNSLTKQLHTPDVFLLKSCKSQKRLERLIMLQVSKVYFPNNGGNCGLFYEIPEQNIGILKPDKVPVPYLNTEIYSRWQQSCVVRSVIL